MIVVWVCLTWVGIAAASPLWLKARKVRRARRLDRRYPVQAIICNVSKDQPEGNHDGAHHRGVREP